MTACQNWVGTDLAADVAQFFAEQAGLEPGAGHPAGIWRAGIHLGPGR